MNGSAPLGSGSVVDVQAETKTTSRVPAKSLLLDAAFRRVVFFTVVECSFRQRVAANYYKAVDPTLKAGVISLGSVTVAPSGTGIGILNR